MRTLPCLGIEIRFWEIKLYRWSNSRSMDSEEKGPGARDGVPGGCGRELGLFCLSDLCKWEVHFVFSSKTIF